MSTATPSVQVYHVPTATPLSKSTTSTATPSVQVYHVHSHPSVQVYHVHSHHPCPSNIHVHEATPLSK
ncbi:unnamed protein product [Staurois parvus]|uniref:Uncharacterized protein n=1 Tax=Staurois parvus TaxID=386267 RepID=A0ABN9CTY0_9NEOB|nr:unnamed protein product [Staurois parvus]